MSTAREAGSGAALFVVLREFAGGALDRSITHREVERLAAHAQTNNGRLQIQPALTVADKRDSVTGSARVIAVRHPLRRSDDPRRRRPR